MYQRISRARLKGGEPAEIGFVQGPDPAWAGRLLPFLQHKQPWFLFHIAKALVEPLDDLRTRFYLATVRDEIIASVMVVSAHGAGILGHVYTAPDWRRQGAIASVMDALMADIAGLDVVTLSTRYDSVAYHIYHGFGFRPVAAGSGEMRLLRRPTGAGRGPCAVDPLRWHDWPLYSCATLREFGNEPAPRSPAVGIRHRGNSEAGFLQLMQLALAGQSSNVVLHDERQAVLGWCHVVPERGLLDGTHMLDLHTLPGFEAHLPELVDRMTWPAGPTTFVMSRSFEAYAKAVSAAGFVVDRRLSAAVAALGRSAPPEVWVRNN